MERIDAMGEIITAIGEILNLGTGSASNLLSSIFNKNVVLSTEKASLASSDDLKLMISNYDIYSAFVFNGDISGKGVMLSPGTDAKKILGLLIDAGSGFDEISLSTLKEINQNMLQSTASAISEFSDKSVEVSVLGVNTFSNSDIVYNELENGTADTAGCFKLKLEIHDYITSEIVIILSRNVLDMLSDILPDSVARKNKTNTKEADGMGKPAEITNITGKSSGGGDPFAELAEDTGGMTNMPVFKSGADNFTEKIDAYKVRSGRTSIKATVFPDFSKSSNVFISHSPDESTDLLMDVTMDINIELGRTNETMKTIMNYTKGSIINLEKQAGAPVDVVVNGQIVARGDVIVIDENFGVRLTEIVGDSSFVQRKYK